MEEEIPFIFMNVCTIAFFFCCCSNGMKVRRQDICFTFLPRGFRNSIVCSTTYYVLIYVEVEGLLHYPSITTKFTMLYLEIEHNETGFVLYFQYLILLCINADYILDRGLGSRNLALGLDSYKIFPGMFLGLIVDSFK